MSEIVLENKSVLEIGDIYLYLGLCSGRNVVFSVKNGARCRLYSLRYVRMLGLGFEVSFGRMMRYNRREPVSVGMSHRFEVIVLRSKRGCLFGSYTTLLLKYRNPWGILTLFLSSIQP